MKYSKFIKNDYVGFLSICFPFVFAVFIAIAKPDFIGTVIMGTIGIVMLALHFARFITVRNVIGHGATINATITGIFFYRDRGNFTFTYSYEGKDYKGKNVIMKNKLTKTLEPGDTVQICVSQSNPKKAFARILYCKEEYGMVRHAQRKEHVFCSDTVFEKITREIIDETKKDYIQVKVSGNQAELFQSKLGGIPYLPKDEQIPLDSNGNQMFFLAQVNFSEVPHLENYPEKGIVQFYCSGNDMYGLDFKDQITQKDFAVRYYETIDFSVEEKDVAEKIKEMPENFCTPIIHGNLALEFKKDQEPCPYYSDKFDELFFVKLRKYMPDFNEEKVYDLTDVQMEYLETKYNSNPSFSKIGGYGNFCQEDPRISYSEDSFDSVLLQLDSDENVMFGDTGIANFFINSGNLSCRDFSRIMFNWDCM